jgi:hypothetical protein
MGAKVFTRTISLDGRKNLDAEAIVDDDVLPAALRAAVEGLQ